MLTLPAFSHRPFHSCAGHRLLLSLLIALAIVAGDAIAAPSGTKVAVLDFEQRSDVAGSMPDLGVLVADWLITGLVSDGRYQVIERRYLQKLLKEQKFQASGLADGHSTTDIGKLLGVQYIITGTVARLDSSTEATIRVVDVETAAILSARAVRAATAGDLRGQLQEMAAYLIEGKRLHPKWSTYAQDPATSSVVVDDNGIAAWKYTVPEIRDDTCAGLEGKTEHVSLSGRSMYITLHAQEGMPLYILLLSNVEGYSRPGEQDTLVPGEAFLELSPGKQELVIKPGDLQVPEWWRDEHDDTDVRFDAGDIRMVDFNCDIDEETGPVSDHIRIIDIIIR